MQVHDAAVNVSLHKQHWGGGVDALLNANDCH
jgi:hypothetical protein